MNEFNLNIVLPPLPPFPKSGTVSIEQSGIPALEKLSGDMPDRVEHTIFGTPQVWPLRLKLKSEPESDFWLLPVEPQITIGGKNILIKRNVSKSALRGSIKERWAQDDYQITISGLFTTKDDFEFPANDVDKLRRLCEAKEPIDVLCYPFEILGISRIVIENYDLPFTKGVENQNWQLSCLSDDDWDLFIKLDTK